MDALPILDGKGIQAQVLRSMRREPSPVRDILALFKLRRIIKDFKPHIIHSHGAKSGFIARVLGRYLKVPVVIHTYHGHTFHSYFKGWRQRFFIRLERFANRKVDGIVALCESQKKELTEKFGVCTPNQVSIIPLGFDIDGYLLHWEEHRKEFRESLQVKDGQFLIGWIGRMVPIKDPLLFVKVIGELVEKGLPIKGVMVGDGPLRSKVVDLAEAQLGPDWGSHLQISSWIHPPQKAMAGFDILMLTSWNEGTPLSILEAGVGGIPVVSVDVGGVSESMLNEESGFLNSTRNPSDLAYLTETIIMDDQLRSSMGSKGQEFVRNHFKSERLLADIVSLYTRLLESKGIKVLSS